MLKCPSDLSSLIVIFKMQGGWVYIMTNQWNNVLYVGVTSNLSVRVRQHMQQNSVKSFTAKYHVYKLVYYQWFPTIEEAIAEEKRIKGGSRLKKIKLVNSMNSEWRDLLDTLR
jgi:putative endonuclease